MDLQPFIGKKELRYSLKTGYLAEAKSKARILAGGVQLLFQELRGNKPSLMEFSDEQIQELVLKHLEKIKACYDKPVAYDPDDPPPFEDQTDFRK